MMIFVQVYPGFQEASFPDLIFGICAQIPLTLRGLGMLKDKAKIIELRGEEGSRMGAGIIEGDEKKWRIDFAFIW